MNNQELEEIIDNLRVRIDIIAGVIFGLVVLYFIFN